MDAVISWNYDHLVSLTKLKKINIVNEIMGYKVKGQLSGVVIYK